LHPATPTGTSAGVPAIAGSPSPYLFQELTTVEDQKPHLMLEAVSEHILNTGDQEQLSSLIALAKRALTDEAAAKAICQPNVGGIPIV
jgi:hypothetical protein